MFPTIFFDYADQPGIRRADIASLSQQTLMELLVDAFPNKDVFFDESYDYFDDIWDAQIEMVDVIPPGGRIDLKWVPPEVEIIQMHLLNLRGRVETAALPRGLVNLGLSENHFSGTFRLRTLPPKIRKIIISTNKFEGSLELNEMPQSLQWFYADDNGLSGSLDFRNLPEHLEGLKLSNNKFSGLIDLGNVGLDLRYFWIHSNDLSQDVLRIGKHRKDFDTFQIDASHFKSVFGPDGERFWG